MTKKLELLLLLAMSAQLSLPHSVSRGRPGHLGRPSANIRWRSRSIKSSSLGSRPQGGNIRWDEIRLPGRQLRPVMLQLQMSSMPKEVGSRVGIVELYWWWTRVVTRGRRRLAGGTEMID